MLEERLRRQMPLARPPRGETSVIVQSFASPISVSSKRFSSTASPFGWRAVGGDLADAEMIILEHLEAALLLDAVVLALGAPAHHRFLVAPGRERKHAPLGRWPREALIVDEAVDLLELRLQLLGERKIVVPRSSFGCTSKMTANMVLSSFLDRRRQAPVLRRFVSPSRKALVSR